jgi:hypothetical protein
VGGTRKLRFDGTSLSQENCLHPVRVVSPAGRNGLAAHRPVFSGDTGENAHAVPTGGSPTSLSPVIAEGMGRVHYPGVLPGRFVGRHVARYLTNENSLVQTILDLSSLTFTRCNLSNTQR